MTTKILELIAKAKDQASPVLKDVGGTVAKLGTAAATAGTVGLAIAGAAVVALGVAAVAAAVEITKLTLAAAEVEGTRQTFINLTEDLGGQAYALDLLKEATRGMVDETTLMQGANKFLAMGLADSIEEAAGMAEMATQLGIAMGEEAGPAMENFALMLANTSIPRLDSFAISSGEATEMINAMMEADESLTREMAFTTVVMELGAGAMEKVGEQGDSAQAAMLRWDASMSDLRLNLGQAFLPALEAVMIPLQGLIEEYGPGVVAVAERMGKWLGDNLPGALEKLVKFLEDSVFPALIWLKGMAMTFYEAVLPHLVNAWELLKGGFEAIVRIYNASLKPALAELAEALGLGDVKAGGIAETLGKFFGILVEGMAGGTLMMIVEGINLLAAGARAAASAIEWVKDVLDRFDGTLRKVSDMLSWMKDRIWGAIDAFNNLRLPDWLIPGSPAPLETALLGIGQAFNKMPQLASLGGGGGGVGGGGRVVQVTNHFGRDSVRSDADIRAIVDGIQRSIELQGLRGRIA